MKYVIGIDQGGSKTHALLLDENGYVHGIGKSYGACHSNDGMDYAMAAVKAAVEQALLQGEVNICEISAIFAGMTGVDWDFEEDLLTKAMREAFPVEKVKVVNDCIIAMRAGSGKDRSCILCAGSGLNCAVKNGNENLFVYGFYIDDEFQGGLALGKKTVRAVTDSYIGLVQETILTNMVLEYFGISSVDELLYRKVTGVISSKDYMSLPIILAEAAARNDKVALELIADYGKNIAMYAVKGMERLGMLDMDLDVVLSGSIFKCRVPVLREAVALQIHKYAIKARIIDAVFEPVVGAALLGLEFVNNTILPEIYNNLERSSALFQIKRMSTAL